MQIVHFDENPDFLLVVDANYNEKNTLRRNFIQIKGAIWRIKIFNDTIKYVEKNSIHTIEITSYSSEAKGIPDNLKKVSKHPLRESIKFFCKAYLCHFSAIVGHELPKVYPTTSKKWQNQTLRRILSSTTSQKWQI